MSENKQKTATGPTRRRPTSPRIFSAAAGARDSGVFSEVETVPMSVVLGVAKNKQGVGREWEKAKAGFTSGVSIQLPKLSPDAARNATGATFAWGPGPFRPLDFSGPHTPRECEAPPEDHSQLVGAYRPFMGRRYSSRISRVRILCIDSDIMILLLFRSSGWAS